MIEICYIKGYDYESSIKTAKVEYNSKVVSAKFLYSYLGTNYKHIWQPKVGTKVLVFFSGDGADDGIILGCLEKKDEESLLSCSDKGEKELFQHENGSKVEFQNTENDCKIKVSTPKEDEVNIDLNNQVLEMKNKGGNLCLSFDFKESKITLKSNELSIEATKSIALKAADFKVESSNSFELKSGSININANQNINISANATTNIKGQSINLN